MLGVLRRLITLPLTVVGGAAELAARNKALSSDALGGIPKAVDNMSPRHRFVRTLSASPIAPGVSVHSIVAVPEEGPPEGAPGGRGVGKDRPLVPLDSEHTGHDSGGAADSLRAPRDSVRARVRGGRASGRRRGAHAQAGATDGGDGRNAATLIRMSSTGITTKEEHR